MTLPPAGDSLHNDFGELTAAKVSGFVYVDNNLDGVFDAGDTPIPGALVNISRLNADGSLTFLVHDAGRRGRLVFVHRSPGDVHHHADGHPRPDPRRGQHRQPRRLLGAGRPDLALPAGGDGSNYDFGYVTPPVIPTPPVSRR